jgi:phosphatidate phosphatase APP1
MESDEVPGARLRATFGGRSVETISDNEGYFSVELEAPGSPSGWHEIQLELPDFAAAETGKGIHSAVGRRIRSRQRPGRHRHTKRRHAQSPHAGEARVVERPHAQAVRGRGGFLPGAAPRAQSFLLRLEEPAQPVLAAGGIPAAPAVARRTAACCATLACVRARITRPARSRKSSTTYPALRFILIGDSGEQDPEIYADILGRFPERIRVIYIRSIDRSPARLKAIDQLAKQVASTGCQLVLAQDSEFAAAHAAAEGLIAPAELAKVRFDKIADGKA